MDREKAIQKRLNLKQNRGKSPEEVATEYDKEQEEESLLTSFVGLNDNEKQRALQLYNRYLNEHSFEALAEKSLLIDLVRDELIKERIAKQIEEEYKTKNEANSLRLIESLREIEEHILLQKEKLGMMKDVESESALDLFNELKEKALAYYETHAGETYIKCPECQNLFRLLMKVDNLEPAKATFFRGTTLYNQKLMELYHYKKVTLEEVAEIFGVNHKYVTFIYENIYLKKNDSQN